MRQYSAGRFQQHDDDSSGVVYQPRGSWLTMQGNGNITSSTMFVTGAIKLQGCADLKLIDTRDALEEPIAVLIEYLKTHSTYFRR